MEQFGASLIGSSSIYGYSDYIIYPIINQYYNNKYVLTFLGLLPLFFFY